MVDLFTLKKRVSLIAVTVLCGLFSGAALQTYAQTHTPITAKIDPAIHGYWEYLPAGYATSGKNYPLLIFLHGTGERGNGSQTALKKVLKNGPPKLISQGIFPQSFTVNGKKFSFIVISPQLTTDNRNDGIIRDVIKYCEKRYRIDQSRIYVTGLSQGGGTLWQFSGSRVSNSKMIAAQIPICGNYPPDNGMARNMAKADLPTWAIHNKGDNIINSSTSVEWVNDINRAGVKPKAQLTIFDARGHDAWSKAYDPDWRNNGMNVYEWMLQYTRGISNGGETPNQAPVAQITGASNITLPVKSTTLDGSTSTDKDGSIKKYAWSYVSGPAGYTMRASSSSLKISKLVAGNYSFRLTVTDNQGATGAATFSFKVNAANLAPVANIINSATITLPDRSLVLDGSSSNDKDGSIKSYNWKYVSGPSRYNLSASNTSKVTVTNLGKGKYTFLLTVTDDKGATGTAKATFSVKKSPKPPVAVIKGKNSITLPVNSLSLDGTGSSSANGIKTYRWKKTSGPATYAVDNVTKPVITASKLKAGNYTFELDVTDEENVTANTTFTFAVNSTATNVSPSAVITGSKGVTLPTSTMVLDGSSSKDNDGTIKTYAWKHVSGTGPTTYTLSGTTTSKLTINNLSAGTYAFQLTVTDDKGATSSTDYAFTVNAVNQAPVAVISAGKGVTLPIDDMKLDGSASKDNDGSIKSYAWKYVSGTGTTSYTLSGTTSSILNVSNLSAGTYSFQLTVTDDKGATDNATASFTVNPAATSGDCGCTITLKPDIYNGIRVKGDEVGAKPGSVVCIKAGTYDNISLTNFNGTSTNPITIKNCGGPVTLNGTAAKIGIGSSSYFRFTGSGSADKYGFKVITPAQGTYSGIGFSASLCTDYEVDHLDISRANIGVMIKTDPTCDPLTTTTVMRNVSVHDMYIHDIINEAVYCGYSFETITLNCSGVTKTLYPQEIKGLKIFNLVIDDIGWDGIQVSRAPENVLIYNNKVTNYATAFKSGQNSGIIIGAGTNARIYNNIVMKGSGDGLTIFGSGKTYVYNNILADVTTDPTSFGSAVFIDTRPHIGSTTLTVFMANNTIINPKNYGVSLFNSYNMVGSDNSFYNNFIVLKSTDANYNGIGGYVPFTQSNNLRVNTLTDAKFVNGAGANYKLTSTSPAVDKGKDLSSYNISGLSKDLAGVARPQNGKYDIGAYEYAAAAARIGNETSLSNNESISLSKIDPATASDKAALQLSPVPAIDNLKVSLNHQYTGQTTIRITDASGRAIIQKTGIKDAAAWQTEINVSSLTPGMYFVEAVTGDKKFNKKFTKIK